MLKSNLRGRVYSQPKNSSVEELKWAIEAVSRRVPGCNCLVQGLAGARLLRSYGHPAELKIGVSRFDGSFDAHAWVELDERVVLGGSDSARNFQPLPLRES